MALSMLAGGISTLIQNGMERRARTRGTTSQGAQFLSRATGKYMSLIFVMFY